MSAVSLRAAHRFGQLAERGAYLLLARFRVDLHRHGDLRVPEDALSHLRVDLQGDQERAAGVPGVPERDDPETGTAGAQGEHAGEVAGFDGRPVLRGEDEPAAVLPELPSRLPIPVLLSAAHAERLEAERREGKKVVGLLGLRLSVQDLTKSIDFQVRPRTSPRRSPRQSTRTQAANSGSSRARESA